MFKAISDDHFTVERILAIHNNFIFVGCVEPTWIKLFEAIEQPSIGLQNDELVVYIGGRGHSDAADIVTGVEKKAVSTQVSQ